MTGGRLPTMISYFTLMAHQSIGITLENISKQLAKAKISHELPRFAILMATWAPKEKLCALFAPLLRPLIKMTSVTKESESAFGAPAFGFHDIPATSGFSLSLPFYAELSTSHSEGPSWQQRWSNSRWFCSLETSSATSQDSALYMFMATFETSSGVIVVNPCYYPRQWVQVDKEQSRSSVFLSENCSPFMSAFGSWSLFGLRKYIAA